MLKAINAGFGHMTEAGTCACVFVKQMFTMKNEIGCFVMQHDYDTARLPMIVPKRSHRKMFKIWVLLLMLLPVTSYAITPPGTPINNTASAAFTVGGIPGSVNSNTATISSTIISTPSTITLLQFAPLGIGTVNVDAVTSHATIGPPGSGFVVSANPVVPVAGAAPLVIDPTLTIALNAVDAYHTGEPIFVHVDDQDQNLNPAIREIITVVVNSPATGDEEEITLIETGVNTGEFVGYVQSTPAAGPAYNGLLTLGQNTNIVVTYVDQFDALDTSSATELIDPFGILFDSVDGSTLDGLTITILDNLVILQMCLAMMVSVYIQTYWSQVALQ